MEPRVAITKSRLHRGGVFDVLLGIIRVLNDRGIEPDLLTLKSHISQSDIQRLYGSDLKVNIREIAVNPTLPYEWHFLWFNLISRRYLDGYDLIVNSSNTSFLTGFKAKTLCYVHYPRRDRVRSPKQSIHFPDGPGKSFLDVGSDPFWLASLLYKFDTRSHGGERVIANSEFTKQAILANFSLDPTAVQVIYPPVRFERRSSLGAERNLVASLGRFEPYKRQLEQIQIAESLPELDFHIMGFAGGDDYADRCARYVESRNLQNVKLLVNGSRDEVQDTLSRARFFLHTMQNEPFGITTVQAIAQGCIPVVHDSGGQREVVPIDELRFTGRDEASTKLMRLFESDSGLGQTLSQLQTSIQRFSEEAFIREIGDVITDMLDQNEERRTA